MGRTEADTDAGLAHLPSVGLLLAPDLERLGALRPDLVVAWSRSDTAALRRALPEETRIMAAEIQRLDDVLPTLSRLAGFLGPEARARAEELARSWELELGQISLPEGGAHPPVGTGGSGPRPSRPGVLWVVWADPLTVAAPGTHVDDLLTWAGGTNVMGAENGAWPTLSWEAATALDPTVVVWGDRSGVADPGKTPGPWQAIPAVLEGRVLVVSSDSAHVPGLHSPALARGLAHRLSAILAESRDER